MNEKLRTELKASMNEKRWIHCEGVEAEAIKLAKRFGVDEKKAALAGILHDCAKGIDIEEQKRQCTVIGIELDEETVAVPAVIHAILGAEMARYKYGICDEEILSAIRKHTVGAEKMSKLDMIIYIADMIEPTRNYDGVEELRKTAYEDLESAMLAALDRSIMFNIKKENIIHTESIICRNGIIKNMEENND